MGKMKGEECIFVFMRDSTRIIKYLEQGRHEIIISTPTKSLGWDVDTGLGGGGQ